MSARGFLKVEEAGKAGYTTNSSNVIIYFHSIIKNINIFICIYYLFIHLVYIVKFKYLQKIFYRL